MLDTQYIVEIPEGIELQLPLANPLERVLAYALDLLIRFGVYFVVSIILQYFGYFGQGIFLIIVFIMEWFYPVFFEIYNKGATIGKKAFNIVVVHDDGTPVSWASSIVRNLLRAVDMLPIGYLFGLVSMLLNKNFKRLGDLAAGTLVIRNEPIKHHPVTSELKGKSPSVPLTLEEQNAILSFSERTTTLSEARCHELADILSPMFPEQTAKDRMNEIIAISNWLRGKK